MEAANRRALGLVRSVPWPKVLVADACVRDAVDQGILSVADAVVRAGDAWGVTVTARLH